MNKIIVTTDSGIDPINEEEMISGIICRDGVDSFRDIKEITQKEILDQLKMGHIFKTSSPIMGDYYDKFEEILKSGNDVIHLCMSSGISEGSVNTPNVVANDLNEEYDNNVYIIDTLNATTGGTIINEIAKDLVKDGLTTKEIVEKLEKIKRYVKTSFYVPNPEGFIRSGRDKSSLCLKEKALIIGAKASKVAGIKFRVNFNEEGNLYTKKMMRCRTSDGMLKLVKEIINEDNKNNYDSNYVVVGNVYEDKVSMEELKSYLESLKYFKKIINKDINGVVACYGSEDLCGISLVKKYR